MNSIDRTADDAARRPVGRPRHYDDDAERELILAAAYVTLRDHGAGFTIARILDTARVSTRSFYRQFPSKDDLLCAMYRRDAEWAAARIEARLADSVSPVDAVQSWIDEIYGLQRDPRRAERVAVLGSIPLTSAEQGPTEAAHARGLLVAPLRAAIEAGIGTDFTTEDPAAAAGLIAAAVMYAAGLTPQESADTEYPQSQVTELCLRAIQTAT